MSDTLTAMRHHLGDQVVMRVVRDNSNKQRAEETGLDFPAIVVAVTDDVLYVKAPDHFNDTFEFDAVSGKYVGTKKQPWAYAAIRRAKGGAA